MTDRKILERDTGALFSDLWNRYDELLFEASVDLFLQRLRLAGFDTSWFQGKRCLDAGCGGGRNSIAMARLGASEVIGIDVGAGGLDDARSRGRNLDNLKFQHASILEMPFDDNSFDMVWCAGVLMLVADDERAIDELTRVTKPGGTLYLLVYATGGMRWPMVEWLRVPSANIGKDLLDAAIEKAGLAPNKRRTILDDLLAPRIDTYHWDRLERMLRRRGFEHIQRWGPACRLDHEMDLKSYREDLQCFRDTFAAGEDEGQFGSKAGLFAQGRAALDGALNIIRWYEAAVAAGEMTLEAAMNETIGQGHHRVLARKV